MKIAILGHSYVRDLATLGNFSTSIQQQDFEIQYFSFPGARYSKFLADTRLLDGLIHESPEFLVVILAGNSILHKFDNKTIYDQCKQFYTYLRQKLPNTIIISAQVELRYYSPNNSWGAPSGDEYKNRRNTINTFLSRFKLKDSLLMIAGPGRLDNPEYYRDEVHLNNDGLKKYFSCILSAVEFSYRKFKCKH